MPRVNIYIRNEDYDKWQAINDKPSWIAINLNGGVLPLRLLPEFLDKAKFDDSHTIGQLKDYIKEQLAKPKPAFRYTTKDKVHVIRTPQDDGTHKVEVNLCEHYQPKGQCLVKGCKFGRGKK